MTVLALIIHAGHALPWRGAERRFVATGAPSFRFVPVPASWGRQP